ncbi:MAG: amidohydrolase [Anaerolineae bacterium]|nr:MAG: amidohydrolase [Anaerolineae bacterium]MCL4880267.1 amidohydrolase [Anaerolineae bacterium]
MDKARSIEDLIIAWRRDIHMHPELGFEEVRTSRLVADTLRDMGIEVEVGVGKTGVVARLGEGKPAIGIRADMDALPIQEENNVPYASQTPGVMHACGHDAHTAMLLGVAKMLNEMPDRPTGEIRLLFQPCEEKQDSEGKSGASRMIDDGALQGLDAVIALHVASEDPAGKIEIGSGYLMAAADRFIATITGVGCHGASPHTGVDPIFLQAQVVNAIQGIVSRRVKPIEPAVITIGSIHGGNAHNVIPAEVKLEGTIRSYSEETRQLLHDELDKAFSIVRAMGGDYTLTIKQGYPSLNNHQKVAELIRQVAVESLGEAALKPAEPTMGAEDFAYMIQKAPGAMFFLGARIGDEHRPHHSPVFNIDESVLHIGAAMLAETACRLLQDS